MGSDDERRRLGRSGWEWRVLTRGRAGREITASGDWFDELVVDQWLHVENLEPDLYWLRVGDADLRAEIGKDGGVTVKVTRGFHGSVRGTTEFHEPSDVQAGERAEAFRSIVEHARTLAPGVIINTGSPHPFGMELLGRERRLLVHVGSERSIGISWRDPSDRRLGPHDAEVSSVEAAIDLIDGFLA